MTSDKAVRQPPFSKGIMKKIEEPWVSSPGSKVGPGCASAPSVLKLLTLTADARRGTHARESQPRALQRRLAPPPASIDGCVDKSRSTSTTPQTLK